MSFRLGDELDDYCIKCRRLTNHAIVSLMDGAAAKVRCKSCYGDHDYRHEQIPPSKKDLKKAALFNEVLAGAGVPEAPADVAEDAVIEPELETETETEKPAAKKSKKTAE